MRTELTRCTITAPGAGLVILPEIWKGGSRGKVSTGDTIYRGSTIITLPDMSEMEVEAWVHEVDAGLVAAGMPVSVVIDAYPDPPFEARIGKIADLTIPLNKVVLILSKRVPIISSIIQYVPSLKAYFDCQTAVMMTRRCSPSRQQRTGSSTIQRTQNGPNFSATFIPTGRIKPAA
jgi:hypothetical protein